MGLDMYLQKKEKIEKRIVYAEIGYWRKANAIHKWFVDNTQNGIDQCKRSKVSKKNLEELLALITAIQSNPGIAPQLLPTTSGFFFGSTEYNKWYYKDIDDTKKIIEKALKDPDDIYYEASW